MRIRWTGVPARRLRGRELNWRVNAVVALAAVAALAGPAALLVAMRPAPVFDQPFQIDQVAALAERVAVDYLSGQYTRVFAASGVDTTFGAPRRSDGLIDPEYRRQPLTQVASTQVVDRQERFYGDRPYQLVTVQALGRDGSAWQVAVAVYPQGPQLAATPSLVPLAPTTQAQLPALDYRGDTSQVAPPAPVVSLVAEWATAWAAGDSATLKRLTGDTAPGVYRGLGGFGVERTVLISAVTIDSDPAAAAPLRLVVRVAVWVRAPGANVSGQSVELDLLVVDAASDLPKVTAWGPAGSVPLVSFANRQPAG